MIFKVILILAALALGAAIIYDKITGRRVTRKVLWPIMIGFAAVVIAVMVRGISIDGRPGFAGLRRGGRVVTPHGAPYRQSMMQARDLRILAVAVFAALGSAVAVSHARADYEAGLRALEAHDYSRARALLMDVADAGDADAQYRLGILFDRGRGGMASPKAASIWFERAAGQGHTAARHALGTYYELGKGVGKDMARAAHWYGLAAASGDAKSQRNLGNLYLLGHGVARDYARAAGLFQAALDGGNARAAKNLGYMYYFGLGVKKDLARAASLFQLGSTADHATAEFALALLYYEGNVVPQSFEVAHRLFRRAADAGLVDAQLMVARMLIDGEGVAADPVEAWFWLLLAEAQKPDAARYYFDRLGDAVPEAARAAAEERARAWQPRD